MFLCPIIEVFAQEQRFEGGGRRRIPWRKQEVSGGGYHGYTSGGLVVGVAQSETMGPSWSDI